MNIGYARETAGDLSLDEQTARLKAAGCVDVFHETNWKKRVVLWQAVQACGRGDTLVAVDLVRMAWSARELLELHSALTERGAGFLPLKEKWADPTNEQGRKFPAVLEHIATFEAEAMADKMRALKAEAIAKGRARGREKKFTPEDEAEIRAEYKPGVTTLAALAERHNVHPSTISRIVSPPNRKTV